MPHAAADEAASRAEHVEGVPPRSSCTSRWPVVTASLRQGIGLSTDLYDLLVVNAVRPQFERRFGTMTSMQNGGLTSASHLGAIFGQLSFGLIADRFGRRRAFICSACLMCVSAAGAALAAPVGPLSVVQLAMFWRFCLGIGIGGEYPLSSAVTAERASPEDSAVHMAALCCCFLVGMMLVPVVVLSCLCFGCSDEATWRISIGGGAVLAFVGACLRWRGLEESASWLRVKEAAPDNNFVSLSTFRAVGRPLAGTILIWFVYDLISYGLGAYTSTLYSGQTPIWTQLRLVAIILMSAPGFAALFFIGRFGRKRAQLTGFFAMGLVFLIMARHYSKDNTVSSAVDVALYGLQKIFDAAGPAGTTFIIPAEIFPTAIRASCHGFSAAGGKLGAFVGSLLFPAFKHTVGDSMVFTTAGVMCFVAVLLTVLLTPPYDAETLRLLDSRSRTTPGDITDTTTILWSHSSRKLQARAGGEFLQAATRPGAPVERC